MGSKLRVTLTVKLLIMILAVILFTSITIGAVAYSTASKGMTQSVFSHIDAVSSDVVNQIVGINEKHLTSIRFIANLDFMKDETVPLADKQKALTTIVAALGKKYENVAFYDKDGNAITADGRMINMATRIYFTEPMAGRDYISNPAFSPITNGILQQYSVPVFNNSGKPIGAVVMLINGNALYDTIVNFDMGGGMHPSVIDWKEGVTIANANEGTDESANGSEGEGLSETEGLGLVLNNIFAGKEGIESFVDPNIHAHLIASYKKVPGTTWTVFAVAPYMFYFGILSKMQKTLAFIITLTIVIAVIIIAFLVRLLVRPLKTVKTSVNTIASGNADLTQRIPTATNDEIGDVVTGFNAFVEKLHGIVSNLKTSKNNLMKVDTELQETTQDASASITEIIANIESVNKQIVSQADSVQETVGAVNQISSNIDSLERMIESQAACVTEASASVEEMIGNINSVNNSVVKMIDSFHTLQTHSSEGFTTQNNANEKIMRIEEQSKMLQDANTAIANIAEQTNLLAMNAAIEAAHAGEAGKGFAVVADEIRKLSETSTDQSKTIGSELQKIQQTIEEVVSVSAETNTAFTAIEHSITETSQLVEQIRGAMEEQQIGSKQIIDALQSMNNSTSEVRSASNEMSVGNKHIMDEISKLQEATDTMKGSIDEMHIGVERMNATSAALTVITGAVADNIKQIGSEIDLFKV